MDRPQRDRFGELVDMLEGENHSLPDWVEPLVDLIAQVSNGGFSQFVENIGLKGIGRQILDASSDVPELRKLFELVKAAKTGYRAPETEDEADLEPDPAVEALEEYIFDFPAPVLEKVVQFVKGEDQPVTAAANPALAKVLKLQESIWMDYGFDISHLTTGEVKQLAKWLGAVLESGISPSNLDSIDCLP